MRRIAVLLVCLYTTPAGATLLVYEGFDYTVGQNLPGQTNPSNGQMWAQAAPATRTNTIAVASGNLTPPSGLPPATGQSVTITGALGQTTSNFNGPSDRLSVGTAITTGTVYFSFLLRVDALTNSNTTTGGFIMGLNNSIGSQTGNPTTVGARIQARIDPNDLTKYELGIFNGNANGAIPWTSATTSTLNVGGTHFIVASYTFVAGTSNDVGSIWIDPSPIALPPTPNMTAIGDISQVASILLRQSPAPYVTLDELRLGTAWADVTPAVVPEPGAFLFLLVSCGLVAGRNKVVKPLVRQVMCFRRHR